MGKSGEISKAWFSWICGLGFVLAGLLLSIRWRWLGLSFIVAGLTQMIWWVSPSFSFNEASAEYHRMLEHKFMLSMITLFLVLLLWFLFDWRNCKNIGGKPEKGC